MKTPNYVKSNIQYRAWMTIGFFGAVLSSLYMLRVGLENSGGAMILFLGLSLMCGRLAVLRGRYKRSRQILFDKNHADGNLQEQLMRRYQRMITPEFVENMMGFNKSWTDLER